MLWKEIAAGFVIAGYVSLLPSDVFNRLFLTDQPAWIRLPQNVIVGPIVAALAFVCSIGNVPLAAVLWAGGVSFAGVVAFLFADLMIVPIVLYYGKVYGRRFAALLVGIMFGSVAIAALAVHGLFAAVGILPTERPSVASITERHVGWNYTTILDVAFALVFVALIALTLRRGARDPVCGMTVDRHAGKPTSVHDGRTYWFCGPGCQERFDAAPESFTTGGAASARPTSPA
jgi:hypothetical protein